MDVTEYIAAVREQGDLMADALGATAPGAPVASCPEWAVRDLVRHQGGVHRWATAFVAGGLTEPGAVSMDDLVATFPGDAGMVGWFTDGVGDLIGALESARPDLECWAFMAAPSPLAFWARRQAHETAIHRVDAELAAGRDVTACRPSLAADGLDELLTGFVPRRSRRSPGGTGPVKRMAVRCSDVDATWLVRIAPDGVTTEQQSGTGPDDCTVTAPASDLYFTLWNRRAPEGVSVEGDEAVFGKLLAVTRI